MGQVSEFASTFMAQDGHSFCFSGILLRFRTGRNTASERSKGSKIAGHFFYG